MAKKKMTIMSTETREVYVFMRPVSNTRQIWCAGCEEEVEMLAPEEAAAIADVTTRTIYARLEAGQIHHSETAEGNVLVCPKCLLRKQLNEEAPTTFPKKGDFQ